MFAASAVAARLNEIGWIPDYLDDLDADFRAFYGVPDMLALPGPRFFALAERVFAYGGVMSARADALRAAEQQQGTPLITSAGHPRQHPSAVADVADLARDSRFAGIFSTAVVTRA